MKKGVCCGNNGSVCCPSNYRCDENALSCELEDEKRMNDRVRRDVNQCGDSDITFPSDQTCCPTYETSDLSYGCCSYQNLCFSSSFSKEKCLFVCLGSMLFRWHTLL